MRPIADTPRLYVFQAFIQFDFFQLVVNEASHIPRKIVVPENINKNYDPQYNIITNVTQVDENAN